jgi:hypothetical protein
MKSGFQFFLSGMTMKRDQPPHHSLIYPACLIGSRAVALMGIRTDLWSH